MDDSSTIISESDGKLFDYDCMSDSNYSESVTSTSETSKADRIVEFEMKITLFTEETQAARAKKSQCKQKLESLIEKTKQLEDIHEQVGVKTEPMLIQLEDELLKAQSMLSMGQKMLNTLQEYIEFKSIKLELMNLDTEEMETESSPNNLSIHYPTQEQIMEELMERANLENSNANFTEYSKLKEKESDYKKLMERGIRYYNEMLKRGSSPKENCVTECITIPDTQPFDAKF